jgi:hypothetical protein
MGLDPVQFHRMTTRRPQDFVSGTVVIEGTVMSKRTYARGGSVQNEVAVKLAKVLRGEDLAEGMTMRSTFLVAMRRVPQRSAIAPSSSARFVYRTR